MTRTVYEVWRTKHYPENKYSDPKHERRNTVSSYEEARDDVRASAERKLERAERKHGDEETDVYTEEREWEESDAPAASESDLPFGDGSTVRYKTVVRYESGGDSVTVMKTVYSYHIVANDVPEAAE